jgi:hypothetical protein
MAIAEELLWLQKSPGKQNWAAILLNGKVAMFIAGIICGTVIIISILIATKRGGQWWTRENAAYRCVAARNADEDDEMTLYELSSSQSYSDEADDDVFKVSEEGADGEEVP